MNRIWVENELHYVDSLEQILQIVEDKMGADTAEILKTYFDTVKFDKKMCDGECDAVYEIQGHYEHEVSDALEELHDVRGKTKAEQERLMNARRILSRLSA